MSTFLFLTATYWGSQDDEAYNARSRSRNKKQAKHTAKMFDTPVLKYSGGARDQENAPNGAVTSRPR